MFVPGGTTDDLGEPSVGQVQPPPASSLSEGGAEPGFSRQEFGDVVILPESLSYRLKTALLGPPLVTERLSVERLGKPTALGVLAPDCISSTAYGTEEILFELVKAVVLPLSAFCSRSPSQSSSCCCSSPSRTARS